jgi:hypothetical protein
MTNLQEIWKEIEGFEGKYEVSSLGNIRHVKTGKLKKLQIIAKYYYVGLCIGNRKSKSHRVNRLVAAAFVPNPELLPIVRHLDDNKLNNQACNLKWGTHIDNMNDMTTKYRQAKGERTGASKLTEADVIKIRELRKQGLKYDDIVPLFPVNKSVICAICNRKAWQHVA